MKEINIEIEDYTTGKKTKSRAILGEVVTPTGKFQTLRLLDNNLTIYMEVSTTERAIEQLEETLREEQEYSGSLDREIYELEKKIRNLENAL